jgi:hypothetical protein
MKTKFPSDDSDGDDSNDSTDSSASSTSDPADGIAQEFNSPRFGYYTTQYSLDPPAYDALVPNLPKFHRGRKLIFEYDQGLPASTTPSKDWTFIVGIGGAIFLLFYDAQKKKVFSLSGSGQAPAALTIGNLHKKGIKGTTIPMTSVHSATVPGTAEG